MRETLDRLPRRECGQAYADGLRSCRGDLSQIHPSVGKRAPLPLHFLLGELEALLSAEPTFR